MTTTRHPSATVTFDHLYNEEQQPGNVDEIGAAWTIGDATECTEPVTAYAYDDDDERYYTLSVVLPTDSDEEEYALGELINTLGRHAGVTRLTFPGHPELDVS
jgi:hypothetical protein